MWVRAECWTGCSQNITTRSASLCETRCWLDRGPVESEAHVSNMLSAVSVWMWAQTTCWSRGTDEDWGWGGQRGSTPEPESRRSLSAGRNLLGPTWGGQSVCAGAVQGEHTLTVAVLSGGHWRHCWQVRLCPRTWAGMSCCRDWWTVTLWSTTWPSMWIR